MWVGYIPESDGDKAHRAAPVHGIGHNVERESSDHVVHEDAKVVSQVCSRDAERPHGAEHKHVSGKEERRSSGAHSRVLEERVGGLGLECLVVHMVTQDAQRKDGHGKQVAAQVATPSEHLGDRLVVVLVLRHRVPVERVEADAARSKPEAALRKVNHAWDQVVVGQLRKEG